VVPFSWQQGGPITLASDSEERRVIQHRVYPSQLIWKTQQLRRQGGLEQRRLIAYGTKHDGLDPF
jgi:hypothetical protein